jgi:hypothetical protein
VGAVDEILVISNPHSRKHSSQSSVVWYRPQSAEKMAGPFLVRPTKTFEVEMLAVSEGYPPIPLAFFPLFKRAHETRY